MEKEPNLLEPVVASGHFEYRIVDATGVIGRESKYIYLCTECGLRLRQDPLRHVVRVLSLSREVRRANKDSKDHNHMCANKGCKGLKKVVKEPERFKGKENPGIS